MVIAELLETELATPWQRGRNRTCSRARERSATRSPVNLCRRPTAVHRDPLIVRP